MYINNPHISPKGKELRMFMVTWNTYQRAFMTISQYIVGSAYKHMNPKLLASKSLNYIKEKYLTYFLLLIKDILSPFTSRCT